MLDSDEYSRILDILGNRNRRRIISLLQQKPCFVTELSERLTLSPKALIEHLALMERMEILGSYLDDRRRKVLLPDPGHLRQGLLRTAGDGG